VSEAVGQQIGHFHILKPLGEGGMGEVYLAQDSELNREVALKLLPTGMVSDEEHLARFQREIRASAALNHPNIVTVYSVGEEDGQPYYAMELVEGQTLREKVPRGGLPLDEFLRVGVALADAVRAAHDKGIIHRDLKPRNVMITWDGRVKVLDFGLSRLREEEVAEGVTLSANQYTTRVGTVMGTAGYMAPEQVRGEEVDERADIFAVGVILYFAATGQLPFAGRSGSDASAAVLRDEPVPPARLRVDLPPEIDRLIMRCLAKAKDRRIQTALDVRNELEDMQRQLRAEYSGVQERSLAVLPFVDMSSASDQAYLCDGLAEELITALSRIDGLQVTSRTSAFRFRDSDLDIRDIGRQLGVDTVLEGSVRKAGERLRIAVQLIDVLNGYHLWSERFDRTMEDIFAVQDEIAERTVEKLRGILTEDEREAMRLGMTSDPEAHQAYLQGRYLLNRIVQKDFELAREMFRLATERDPEFALAWAGYSIACSWSFQWFRRQDLLEPALEAARRAQELAPNLPEAHAAFGWANTHGEHYKEAEAALRRALELDPSSWDALYLYARLCFTQGHFKAALNYFRRAAEVDPEDYQCLALATLIEVKLGEQKLMEKTARRGIERARRHLLQHPDDARAHYMTAFMLHRLNEPERALEHAKLAEKLSPDDPGTQYNLACFYALAGERDRALDLLEHIAGSGFGNLDWIDRDPDLDSLRDDPRFHALRDRLA
jgi:serine/threonine protein kinase/tetratricopeptide (TPR) repeat protein